MPNASYRTLDTEVLIVGGGLAALRAALAARSAGARVLMLAKRLIGRSGSSTMTTGGYAAAVQNLNSSDSAELHYIDTIAGGGYVNERKLVRALVDDAPARLRELWDYGVQFRKRNGQYHLSPSGDHTQARVFVPEHMRGIDLTLPLRQAVLDAGVDVLEDFMALDLLREEDRVVGAVALGRVKGEAVIVNAKATVLAAGGAGRLFTITSNPVDVCGSGYALALRAGARLRDMEFIQFYPWRLIRPFKSTRVPIQPSTFMMGARLYNSRGERFMEKYDPIKKESAARDVSARGIADQIRQGLAVDGGVVLDVSDVPEDQFRYENSKVVDLLDPKKIDYRQIPLVVAPEAHFFMGGVAIDDCGRASLRGLYAAGESAGGVHGGNRLNSNSIPETQVFGYRAGLTAAREAAVAPPGRGDRHAVDKAEGMLQQVGSDDAVNPAYHELAEALRGVTNVELGIVRTEAGLKRVLAGAGDIGARGGALPVYTIRDILARADVLDLCATATACAASALHRQESRSAHYRSDFPDTNPAWARTIFYESSGVFTREVETGADEGSWDAMRNVAVLTKAAGEKEYVE
ncbi:MAG TPA: FAD-dependent oxidoreductase [Pseudolabrys sp.]|nr:FAD-dependent oxidoreductase [Pseudolabrys sp.]